MKTTLTLLDPADFIGPQPADPVDPADPIDGEAAASGEAADNAVASEAAAETLAAADEETAAASDPAADAPSSRIRYVGPKVKLAISVDEEAFATEIDAAFKKISQNVRVPGFRPGRTPRRVIEAQIGSQAGRAQALEDSIPRMYSQAIRETEVEPVASPEIEVTAGLEDGALEFEAVVEVRPQVEITGYADLQLELPNPQPSDEEIDERVQDTLKQFGDLADVERPAQTGDRVTIDIEGGVDGEPLPGLSAQEYVYEVGTAGIVAEVDDHLTGAKASAVLEFSAPHPTHPDTSIDFQITVHKVSELVLPELTDDWVDENTEYETIEEMKLAFGNQLGFSRRLQANMSMRNEAERLIADLVPSPVPDSMIAGAVTNRIQELGSQLQQREMEFEQWLQQTGQSPDEFMQRLRDESEMGVKLNLALSAVAQAEGLTATDEEVTAEYERLAEANNTDAQSLMASDGPGPTPAAVRSQLALGKAMEYVIENAELVDDQGASIERADLELNPPNQDSANQDPANQDEPENTDTQEDENESQS